MNFENSKVGLNGRRVLAFVTDRGKVNPEGDRLSREKPSVLAAMQGRWNAFVDSSTLHGLRHIFSNRRLFIRVLWALILLSWFGFFMFNSYQLVRKYFSYPVMTKAILRYEKMPEFPAVTICNVNMFRKSQITAYRFEDYIKFLIRDKIRVMGVEVNDSKVDWNSMAKINISWVYHIGGHQIENMLHGCLWSGEKCTTKNFTRVLTSMGLCYTFNSGKDGQSILRIKNAGVSYGLRLILNVEQDDYFGLFDKLAGLRVHVHHHEVPPMVEQLGFSVSPGTSTFAAMQKHEIENLPDPYESKCFNGTISNFPGYTKYTTAGCLLTCQTDYVVEQCGCRDIRMPGADDVKICNLRQTADCVFKGMTNFHRLGDDRCDCPLPCETVTFTPTLSYAGFPNKKYLEDLSQIQGTSYSNMSAARIQKLDEYARENFLELNIYFQELNVFFLKEQEAYGKGSLMGELGGMLGLCLGASVLTVVEFIDVLISMMAIRLGNR